MSEPYNVLVVDDESLNFELIKHAMKGTFKLEYVESGEACLAHVAKMVPDIILLDINMKGMNGYDTCRKLKEDSKTRDIPVIFVSGLDSVEERLAGYDAGGDDYIIKPFQADELMRKVKIAIKNMEEKHNLQKNVSNAMDTAMQAISSTGEIGVVLNFMSRSFTCADHQQLGKTVLDSLAEYKLNCAVQIHTPGTTFDFDTSGVTKPLESALLNKLRDAGRIYDFGPRTIVNFPNISILIKNMPLADQDKYGRYKDNLALLVEGADSRTKAITNEIEVARQQKALKYTVSEIKVALDEVNAQQQSYKLRTAQIMEKLINDVENSFLRLGLTEEQEEGFLSVVTASVNDILALYDKGLAVDDTLNVILQQLEQAIN